MAKIKPVKPGTSKPARAVKATAAKTSGREVDRNAVRQTRRLASNRNESRQTRRLAANRNLSLSLT